MTLPRILVVDDEASMRLTVAGNLELEGFDVIEAKSGEHALTLLETEKVDLVLTDIRMPGINGVELFRRISVKLPGTPVVLMTAFAVEELVSSALREGAFTVLSKPFDVGHMIRTVSRAARMPLVLVVDDVKEDAESTAAALQLAGLRAMPVFSGAEALEVLKDGKVDLCVIDLVMPDLSGAEVIEKLRVENPGLSVIAMSGYSVPELIQKAASFQIFTCMRKPFDPGDLVQAIARARGVQGR